MAHEKVISNKEFNSLEASHNSGEIIQTESGIIFAFQQKANKTAEFEEITLVDFRKSGPRARAKADARRSAKGSGSIIILGVNGYVPQNYYCRYHGNTCNAKPPGGQLLHLFHRIVSSG